MSWFAHAVTCSLYALGFGAYFSEVLPPLGVSPFDLPFLSAEKWLVVGGWCRPRSLCWLLLWRWWN